MNIALIVFAGSGTRIKSLIPKQFIKINGKELVAYTIEKFEDLNEIDEIVLVTNKNYVDYVKRMVFNYRFNKVKYIVEGGASRQESVRLCLEATSYKDDDKILIHDGDRPLVESSSILRCLNELDTYQAAGPFIYSKDELKGVSNSGRKSEKSGLPIDIQTPQGFKYGLIKKYHELMIKEVCTDDISLVEKDIEVSLFEGKNTNIKITTDIDLEYFKSIIK